MTDGSQEDRIGELRSMQEAIDRAPSYREWELLHNVYVAYLQNAHELEQLLDYPQQDPRIAIKLMDPDLTSEEKRSYRQAIFRLLLNYCATASTLVDHSRRFIRRYESIFPDLVGEYERRKNVVVQQAVAHFVQDLRNYMLHYRLPSLTHNLSLTLEGGSIPFTVQFNCAMLAEWSKWSSQAKAYMADKESIVLREAMQEYTVAIQHLYQWFFSLAKETVQQTLSYKADVQNEIFRLSNDG